MRRSFGLHLPAAIASFGFLFLDNPLIRSCNESADVDNGGTIGLSDGIYLLNWLFRGSPGPATPGLACGLDPDPPGSPGDLGCEGYSHCP